MVRILFFGRAAELAGVREMTAPAPDGGCTLGNLKESLESQLSMSLSPPAIRAAVNHEIAEDDTWVNPSAEVAFFSAVSGG